MRLIYTIPKYRQTTSFGNLTHFEFNLSQKHARYYKNSKKINIPIKNKKITA